MTIRSDRSTAVAHPSQAAEIAFDDDNEAELGRHRVIGSRRATCGMYLRTIPRGDETGASTPARIR